MIATNYDGLAWFDLDWADWTSLEPTNDALDAVPTDGGLYRVRHPDHNGLAYIGESGRLRGRLRALARNVTQDRMPFRDPHTAAPCLWAIEDRDGSGLELSWTAPAAANDDQHRKGTEAALIALYRRATGESPTANFGRIIPGYKQSSYARDNERGGRLEGGETESNAAPGVAPREWQSHQDVLASDWMGYEWSATRRLADRLEVDSGIGALYRIWYADATPPLAYIGESSAFRSRLYTHENAFGSHARFDFVPLDGLAIDAAHKRVEVETDLIGAHVIADGRAPRAQFGYTDAVPLD